MDINFNKKNSLSSELNTPVSSNYADDISVDIEKSKHQFDILKKHNFGLKVPEHHARYHIAKNLTKASKFFGSVVNPTVSSLYYTQNVLKKVIVNNPFLKGNAINLTQNIVMSISSTIDLTQKTLTLPSNIHNSFEIRKIKNDFINSFDDNTEYKWANQTSTVSLLNMEYNKLKSQIDNLNNLKIKLNLSEKTPELNEQLQQLDITIDKKRIELDRLNEYLSIKHLENINNTRTRNKLSSILYSSFWLSLRIAVVVACILCGTSYLSFNSSINLFNNFTNYSLKLKSDIQAISKNYSMNLQKKNKARDFVSFVSNIPCNYINMDIVKKSNLGLHPFTKKDFDILLVLKNKSSSDCYFELPQNLVGALSKVGNTYLNPEEVDIIDNFIKDIESSSTENSPYFMNVVKKLRKSINNYHSLYNNVDIDTILYHNNLYTIKKNLQIAYKNNLDILSNSDSLFNRILRGQFFSNRTIFNIAVFDYFANNDNLSSKFKDIINNSYNNENDNIWKSFNLADTFISDTFNTNTANFIVNMVKSLPPKLKLMKDDVEISINDLDLNDEDDRILLNTVYENWALYEHAKSYIDSCLSGKHFKSSSEVINKILNTNDIKKLDDIKKSLIKELSST